MSPLTSCPAEKLLLKPMPVERPTIPEFDSRTEKGHKSVEEGGW
jgi:hypothetical protein